MNNLYWRAMSQNLPEGGFEWVLNGLKIPLNSAHTS